MERREFFTKAAAGLAGITAVDGAALSSPDVEAVYRGWSICRGHRNEGQGWWRVYWHASKRGREPLVVGTAIPCTYQYGGVGPLYPPPGAVTNTMTSLRARIQRDIDAMEAGAI